MTPGQSIFFNLFLAAFFLNHIIFLPIGLFLFIYNAAALHPRNKRISSIIKRNADSIKTRFLYL